MDIDDFDYTLPDRLIAQMPAANRTDSRLMIVDDEARIDARFEDVLTQLRAGDLLVLNDTRVLKARLKGHKSSGGAAEILVERVIGETRALCQVRVSKPLRPGGLVSVGEHALTCVGRAGMFYELEFDSPVLEVLDRVGQVPLPPYIQRNEPEDVERYQTVYSRHAGSVAAPTAGLHFDEPLLDKIRAAGVEIAYVTLHVGAGTFQPVRGAIHTHEMHSEVYRVSSETAQAVAETRGRGGRVVAVGTTVVRTLESVAALHGAVVAESGETTLFIKPGYRFLVVDAMITNFHLPRSTLLMLVSAFAGHDRVMAAYRHAVTQAYRFFSYGDAMWLHRSQEDIDV